MIHSTTTAPHAAASHPDTRVTSLDWLGLLLVLIGGINWGLIGAVQFDVVAWLLGPMTTASRAVYVLIGVAALYCVFAAPGWRRER